MNVDARGLAAVPPPDLEIRVTTPWGSRRGQQLQYILNSPSGAVAFTHHPIPGPQIHDPDSFCERLFREIEGFHHGQDPTGSQVFDVGQDVTAIGKNLFQELLPQEIQLLYPRLRERAQTLVIVSDEAWIPWEMLHPPSQLGGDFMCLEFELSRWLTGPVSYAARLPLLRAAAVATAGEADLPHGQEEVTEIDCKLRAHGVVQCQPVLEPTWQEFRDLIHQNDLDLIHVSGHGRFDAGLKESVLQVARQSFRTLHLGEDTVRNEASRAPFVCFNVCQLGRMAESITQVEGWPARWIRQRRCGGFVGPMWKIRDRPAADFADLFYRQLLEGVPLARALRSTRLALRERSVSPLNWLAYSLYGHPNGLLMPGLDLPPVPARTVGMPQQTETSASAPPPPQRDTSPLRSARSPVSVATPRRALPRPPTAHRVGGPSRALVGWGALIGCVGLLVVAWLWLGPILPGSEPEDGSSQSAGIGTRNPGPSGDATTSDSAALPPVVDPTTENNERTEGQKTATPPPPEPQPVTKQTASPPPPPAKPAFEVAHPQPGKLAIVVMEPSNQIAAMKVARAIESLMIQENLPVSPEVPGMEAKTAADFITNARGNLPLNGTTPWGAESMLLVSSETSSLPSSAPFKSLSLSLQARLIDARSGETLARSAATHTGKGISTDQALVQASKRCLSQVLTYLQENSQ